MDEDFLYPFRNSHEPRAKEAESHFLTAYRHQMKGDLDKAAEHYKKSIRLFPTAEAHTFLGWTYSFQGRLEAAIEECKRAIHVDPDFGNPYNDIGAYLIELGRPREAVPWLQKAMKAPRYEPRHFPHINLARVYILTGELDRALQELQESLRIDPQNPSARRELQRLLARLN